MNAEENEVVGYSKPPAASRFRKGQSGNPQGRPKNRNREIPYDAALGQMVTIREDGRERRVTAAEAFLLQLTQKGLAGDSTAARVLLEAIETARAKTSNEHVGPMRIVWKVVRSGADSILEPLNLARRKFPTDEKLVRWEINPWIVEAALERLGQKRLTLDEQREVWVNTRTPEKVQWPQWWAFPGLIGEPLKLPDNRSVWPERLKPRGEGTLDKGASS